MKKKITAALLTLCMVLGMLPLSALALKYKATIDGKEYTITAADEAAEDGSREVTEVKDGDGQDPDGYYSFKVVKDGEADKLFYYRFDNLTEPKYADLTVEIDVTPDPDGSAKVPATTDVPGDDFIIDCTSDSASKTQASVTIPNVIVGEIQSNVTIKTNAGAFVIGSDAFENIFTAAGGKDVTFSIKEGTPSEAAPKAKVLDVSLMAGNDSDAPKDLGNDIRAKIKVTINIGNFGLSMTDPRLYYVKGSTLGSFQLVASKYDSDEKTLTWETNHLSDWAILEQQDAKNLGLPTANSTGGNGGGGAVSPTGYSISVNRTSNGTVSVSPSRAAKGATVTITVRPDKGYELNKLTVKDADGNTIPVTGAGNDKYTFTMPDGKVEIDATFKAVEAEGDAPAGAPSFRDVPSRFWAYDQIAWAAEKGIMSGYGNGVFGPDRNTTRQVLWMVLGRLNGSNPSDMAAARIWAINNGVSDGTNPEGTMSRQQMVTMLYRYAQIKGYATTGSADISGYPDSAGVESYAQNALSWAVANGIVTGTADGRLNPAGTASRAHFAVFMYRFCNLYDIA